MVHEIRITTTWKSEEWSVMTIEYSVENKEVYHMEWQKSNKEKRG